MTSLAGHIVKCTNVLHSGLERGRQRYGFFSLSEMSGVEFNRLWPSHTCLEENPKITRIHYRSCPRDFGL